MIHKCNQGGTAEIWIQVFVPMQICVGTRAFYFEIRTDTGLWKAPLYNKKINSREADVS